MNQRSLALDVLRASAVGLVMLHHTPKNWLHVLPFPEPVSNALQIGGWIGVDLFFVLSGFLIAGLLFKEHARHGNIQYGRFLLRRGFKIYPAFYVLLATTVAVFWSNRGALPKSLWSEVFFLQSYLRSIWGHTWSLAVEEHFYLSLPLLLWLISRGRQRSADVFGRLPAVCLALAVLLVGLRMRNAIVYPSYDSLIHFKPSHLRVDSMMFGVLLAYLAHYRTQRFEAFCQRFFWSLIVAGVWLLIPAFLSPMPRSPFLYSLGLTQFYLGSGAIIAALVVRGVPANALTRTIGQVGVYSYSIYLWHLPFRAWGPDIYQWAFDAEPLGDAGSFALYVGGSLVVGILMARLIELPVLRIRDRMAPSRSASAPEAGEIALDGVGPAPANPGSAGDDDGECQSGKT